MNNRPFFIWFMGRSGSTYLCDLLNSHPQIYCRQEDFSDVRIADPSNEEMRRLFQLNGACFGRKINMETETIEDPTAQQVIEHLNRIWKYREDFACGFKLKYPNQFAVFPELIEVLYRTKNIRVIELRRENVLKQVVSLRNVDRIHRTGKVRSANSTEKVKLQPLHLDVQMAVGQARYFLRSKTEFQEFSDRFETVLRVSYEELHQSPDQTLNTIQGFLGVPERKLSSQFWKATPDKIADAISNYAELEQAVTGTELEPFLD